MATCVRYELSLPSETHAVHYDHHYSGNLHRQQVSPAQQQYSTQPAAIHSSPYHYHHSVASSYPPQSQPQMPPTAYYGFRAPSSQNAYNLDEYAMKYPNAYHKPISIAEPSSSAFVSAKFVHVPTPSAPTQMINSSHGPMMNNNTPSPYSINPEEDEAADILLEINKSTPTCMGCGVSQTPAWRNGGYLPGGRKRLLCNACGLRYKRNRASGGNSSS
jgi:hypothetical protein